MKRLCGLVLFLLAACAHLSGGDTKVADVSRYYPLAVGNRWTYDTEMLGQKGQQTIQIVGRNGGFFQDDHKGNLTVDAFGVRDKERYLLRAPLEANREWTNVVSVSSIEHYKILEVGTPCEVPAGTFQGCVRVESRNRANEKMTLVNQVTYAPDVGIVRLEVVAETGDRRIPQTLLTLRSFQVAAR